MHYRLRKFSSLLTGFETVSAAFSALRFPCLCLFLHYLLFLSSSPCLFDLSALVLNCTTTINAAVYLVIIIICPVAEIQQRCEV